jgi:hypothetical protein
MLVVAARIPDAAARDQFADRLAHKARITEEVVRTEIRKAAGARKTSVPDRLMAPAGPLKPAERGLLWGLVHDPAAVRPMLEELEDEDLEQLAVAEVVETARELQNVGDLAFPSALLERLNDRLSRQVASAAAETAAPAPSAECVRALKLLRYDRERAALQREIRPASRRRVGRNGNPNRAVVRPESGLEATYRGVVGRMRPRGHDPKPGVAWAGERVSSILEGSAGDDPQLGARRTPLSIEDKYDEVRQLINIGKEKGYLLYDEVNELLPAGNHLV